MHQCSHWDSSYADIVFHFATNRLCYGGLQVYGDAVTTRLDIEGAVIGDPRWDTLGQSLLLLISFSG